MAMKQACDIFDTVKMVRKVEVKVVVVGNDSEPDTLKAFEGHLSVRAVERLMKKVEGGMTPPAPRKNEV